MTADARQQAERIVWRFERFTRHASPTEADCERDRMVALLAAAIELENYTTPLVTESDRVETGGEPADQDWTRPLIAGPVRKHATALREALSTLGVEVDGARPHSGDSAKEDSDE